MVEGLTFQLDWLKPIKSNLQIPVTLFNKGRFHHFPIFTIFHISRIFCFLPEMKKVDGEETATKSFELLFRQIFRNLILKYFCRFTTLTTTNERQQQLKKYDWDRIDRFCFLFCQNKQIEFLFRFVSFEAVLSFLAHDCLKLALTNLFFCVLFHKFSNDLFGLWISG